MIRHFTTGIFINCKNEKAWLTMNTFVSATDCAETLYNEIISLEEKILRRVNVH